jgi:hypothetical protein
MTDHGRTDADRGHVATDLDRDVVVVGGGPAGSSAAVFTARYGLDTVVFDRGNAALQRCAYLENYLGFPGGVDVETFYDLMAAHVEEMGADLVDDMVIGVERVDDGERRLAVETQDGRWVTATAVVAAAWYDGSYLRPLGEEAMFSEQEHHGELEERFDPDYPDADGRTPVEGLYVAAPAGDRNDQAIISAGQGAHVARSVIEDHRRAAGYPAGVAEEYDWLRSTSEFSGEWAERDRWREWFHSEVGDDHGLDDERLAELRERYIDRAFDTAVEEAEAERRADRGVERLVEHLDTGRVLDAVDDERIRAYLAPEAGEPAPDDD